MALFKPRRSRRRRHYKPTRRLIRRATQTKTTYDLERSHRPEIQNRRELASKRQFYAPIKTTKKPTTSTTYTPVRRDRPGTILTPTYSAKTLVADPRVCYKRKQRRAVILAKGLNRSPHKHHYKKWGDPC